MLSLSQRQSLQQRLSPQQVQYLKMLQLPVIALEQRIKQEIEVNPLLEELGDVAQENDQEFDQEPPPSLTERRTEEPGTTGSDDESFGAQEGSRQEFEWEDYMNSESEGYKAPSFTGQDSEEQDEFPQRAEESLSEQLLGQLRMQLMSEDELALAEEIIGNIDDHGYLRRDLKEIVDDLNKFISSTRRSAATSQQPEHHMLGDGHFETYEEAVADAPFGRDRLIAHFLNDGDSVGTSDSSEEEDLPVDPFSVSFDDDDTPSRPHTQNGHSRNGVASHKEVATVAATGSAGSLSLEQMAQLSIEDLARLLEQGTSAIVPASPAISSVSVAAVIDEVSMGSEEFEEIFGLTEAESVLRRIQRLEPPGIGARDLRECLLVQLEVLDEHSASYQLARRMIDDTYTEFTMKHFEKVCHRLGCSTDELKGAIDVIKTLNPKPGEGSVSMIEDNYLTPDFVIERDGEDFIIIPNDRHIPTLRINRAYQELIRRGKGKKNEIDRDTRKFIRDKFEAAKWFIASIQQRRQTMMKVMRAIVDLQIEFFLNGPNHIRPMIYKDVAERIGMDISTVCRVVNGKYTQTDYGTFELRYFFSEKLETTSGEEVSTKIVKSKIEELIAGENKRKPLSDDAISKSMEDAGFYVARRTVAKYREQLNIPVARLRRAL